MTFIGLSLLIVAIGALIAARRHVPGAPLLVILATIGAIAVLIIGAVQRRNASPARLKLEGETAAGEVIGKLLAADIKDGTILVIRNPPRTQMKTEITALRFAGLAAALKDTACQLVQAGPNMANLGTDDSSFTLFSDEGFNSDAAMWFAAHNEVKAVVSLRGVLPPVPAAIPIYGFVDMRDAGWTDAIRSGHIKAAVMYRVRPLPSDTKPETNDGLPPKYMLVTKDTLDASLKELSL